MERVVYFQDIYGNRFYFDIEDGCISVDGPLFIKDMLSVLLKAHVTCQENERVFFEYIPHVFGRPRRTGKIEILTL
jgi:hypothetical protein